METVEIRQIQFLDKVVGRPCVQRQALMVQAVLAVEVLTVLKTLEVRQLQYIAMLVEMPHVQFSKVGFVLVNVHDKLQQLIVMMRKVWVMKVTVFMDFSAIDETYELLWWRL